MKKLLKRSAFFGFITLFCLTFNMSVFSANINSGQEFYNFDEQPQKVCEILKSEQTQLEDYCKENNVVYFAVDNENKRQIKLIKYENDFSNSIVNISSMTSDNISVLIPQIVGIENATGDVFTKGEQKFIKTSVMTKDSGGEYILTSFVTVAQRQNYILHFYTLKGENTEYIDEIFEEYSKSEEFLPEKEKKFNLKRIFIFIGVVVFITIFVLVGTTVIKDLKNPKNEIENLDSEEK